MESGVRRQQERLLTKRRLLPVVDVVHDEVGVGADRDHVLVAGQRLNVERHLHFAPKGVACLLAVDLVDQKGLAQRDADEGVALQWHEGERRGALRLSDLDPLGALVVQTADRDQLDVALLAGQDDDQLVLGRVAAQQDLLRVRHAAEGVDVQVAAEQAVVRAQQQARRVDHAAAVDVVVVAKGGQLEARHDWVHAQRLHRVEHLEREQRQLAGSGAEN